MNLFTSTCLVATSILLAGCGGQTKPSDLVIPVPYNANIWPDAKVEHQTSNVSIVATANGDIKNIKEFYNKSYSSWESLSDWDNRKIVVSRKGGIWKGWKKGQTYLVISLRENSKNNTSAIHSFGSETQYKSITK